MSSPVLAFTGSIPLGLGQWQVSGTCQLSEAVQGQIV